MTPAMLTDIIMQRFHLIKVVDLKVLEIRLENCGEKGQSDLLVKQDTQSANSTDTTLPRTKFCKGYIYRK